MEAERHRNHGMSDSDSDNEDFAKLFEQSLKACVDEKGRQCAKVRIPGGGFKLVPLKDASKAIQEANRRQLAENPLGDNVVRLKTRSQTRKKNESQRSKTRGQTKTRKNIPFMQYPENWVFEFDQETLTTDFESISHIKYLEKGEPSISILKTLSLSFTDYENDLQKQLISQHQLLFSFFNTEFLCNENNYFQYYSQKVVKYIEAEILYSASFWAFGPIKGFVRQRVNASLIRTIKFLTSLQIMVLDKYNKGKNIAFFNENDPEKDSLSQSLEDLLVDYQQLNTLVIYFRKAYADLYAKFQAKNIASQKELDLIGMIVMFCRMFFIANPKAIWKVISKTVPQNADRTVVIEILKVNDDLKNEIYEKTKKYTSLENDKKGIQDYLLMQLGSTSTFKKILKDMDKNHKYPLYEEESLHDRRRAAGKFIVQEGDTLLEKRDDRRRATTKLGDGLKEAFQRNQNEPTAKEVPPKEENKKEKEKEKEQEKMDLLTLLNNSPNSPMKNSRFIPVDARFSHTDYQFSRAGKANDSFNANPRTFSSFLQAEERVQRGREGATSTVGDELLESEFFPPSELSDFVTENMYEADEIDAFLKYRINEDFLNDVSARKLEPKKLQEKNEPRAFQGESKARNFFQRKKPNKGQAPSTQSIFALSNKKDTLSEDQTTLQFSRRTSIHDDEIGSRKRGISLFLNNALMKINEAGEGGYVPAKEDKGLDVPDEQLLEDEDDNEEDEDDEDEDTEKKNKKLRTQREREAEHNKFVNVMQQIKEEESLFTTYFKPAKCTIALRSLENVDIQRRKDKWSFAKDKWRTRQIQNEIVANLDEEDPTFGLNITIRSLEYFSRRTARARNGAIDFTILGKMRQFD